MHKFLVLWKFFQNKTERKLLNVIYITCMLCLCNMNYCLKGPIKELNVLNFLWKKKLSQTKRRMMKGGCYHNV